MANFEPNVTILPSSRPSGGGGLVHSGTSRRTRSLNVSFLDIREEESDSGASDSSASSRIRSQTNTAQMVRDSSRREESSNNAGILLGLKIGIGLIFFVVVLVSSVLSKLTLVSLTDSLRNHTWIYQNKSNPSEDAKKKWNGIHHDDTVSLYWQLLLILLVPNILTFLRCLFFGVLGKTKMTYPWPKCRAVLLGLLGALVEVIAMCTLVFLVLTELSPGVAILVLNGVFFVQILIDVHSSFRTKQCATENCDLHRYPARQDYDRLGQVNSPEREPFFIPAEDGRYKYLMKFLRRLQCVTEFYVVKVIAGVLQFLGVAGLIGYWIYVVKAGKSAGKEVVYLHPLIGLPFVLLALSVIWSNRFQEAIARSDVRKDDKKVSARYKSSLINSFVRLFLYPFVSYVVFRYLTPFPTTIDPWCLKGCTIHFRSDSLNEMIVHIVFSFVGYFVMWVSCIMTLSQLSVGLPLLLSTPVAAIAYYVVDSQKYYSHFFPTFYHDDNVFAHFMPYTPIIAGLLWVGEFIAMAFYICTKTNIILARDKDMFLTPHYDSIFLEQYTILNRQVQKGKENPEDEGDSITAKAHRNPRMIFICSTMYRESEIEMKQMLSSILNVARHYEADKRINEDRCDRYESHIFFDGAINADKIENFGLQLLSLLEDTLHVKLKGYDGAVKKKTPYGYTLTWSIGVTVAMPFVIHFKDKTLVKAKKRWSQVMYMNYILNYRIPKDKLNPDDTFILTTDADIDFKATSVVVLLDMLATNTNVAAVCARTHPKGHGVMYWYQRFDYAIGHWFLKPAEHILGSVLCSPGCFSAFRCSALAEVLEEYSTEATGGSEFLMKDMGEDRWLCTLLIKKGLRLEYCAISEDQTYCPTEFDEFFKQRRRWIPSTMANLFMLVSESGIITRGNDSISILYILFQALIIFSTAISPATVILIISAGLQPLGVPLEATIPILFLVSMLYGLICLYSSPKTQLDISRLLTFCFAVIMSVVIVGIFKDLVDDLIGDQKRIPLGPGDCSRFETPGGNKTAEYYQCIKGQDYAANLTNSVYNPFQLRVSITVIYIGVIIASYIIAALLHPKEFFSLLHGVWYLLGLPSGYLLLLIYSAANLCDRSWGTREQDSGEDEGLWGWRVYFIQAWKFMTSMWCCVRCFVMRGGEAKGMGDAGVEEEAGASKDKKQGVQVEGGGAKGVELVEEGGGAKEVEQEGESEARKTEVEAEDGGVDVEDPVHTESRLVGHVGLNKEAEEWLKMLECEAYAANFESHGYTNTHFISNMTAKDFEAIGISKKGFMLRLEKAAKLLDSFQPESGTHRNVSEWLKYYELEQYSELFRQEGYKWQKDLANMKDAKVDQLKAMGVKKRAHLQRLMKAIQHLSKPPVKYNDINQETIDWLTENECEEYADKFVHHGYTNKQFLAGVKAKELEAIGVEKKGLRLRLEKAAQHLPPLNIKVDVPDSVKVWLADLQLSEYTELFHAEGYNKGEDMVNLKELDIEQLKQLGITKKAHLKRMKIALDSLAIPSAAELNKRRTKSVLEDIKCYTMEELEQGGDYDLTESEFWKNIINRKLKPVSQKFTQVKDIHKSLQSLRNSALAILLLVNLMWIVLLSVLTFTQLEQYKIDPRAFQLLFLAIYGFILLIQFFTMIAHRGVTLVHYLGRVKPREVSVNPWRNYDDGFRVMSVRELDTM